MRLGLGMSNCCSLGLRYRLCTDTLFEIVEVSRFMSVNMECLGMDRQMKHIVRLVHGVSHKLIQKFHHIE